MTFKSFEDTRINDRDPGADALLYVMAYGHTISVPTSALYFAEKIAIRAIADRQTPEPILRDVNRAIDLITASIRNRERLDREDTATVESAPVSSDHPSGQPGKFATLQPQPINRPPSGVKVEIPF